MRKYFVGVDDVTVDRLDKQYRELMANPARRDGEASAFRANGRRYLGQAWKELLSPHEHAATPIELAIWLAIVTPGCPRPRWLHPKELSGKWRSFDAPHATWELAPDGAFSTDEERIKRLRAARWCVHLGARRGDFYRDHLWLGDDAPHTIAARPLLILECTARTLRLLRSGGDFGDEEYWLERSD
jgi:hypothetical protein